MWFKNLQIFRLPPLWLGDITLEEQLARAPFVKCSSNEPSRRGWVAPRNNGQLVYRQGSQLLICLNVEQRLLPSDVVQQELRERGNALEDQQGYAPGRKQMRELKERIIEELLPKAFLRSRRTFAWIDARNGWLVIDAATPAKAEEVVELLRHSLDEFPVSMPRTLLSPSSAMANWLAGGEAPVDFTIDRDCEMQAPGEEKSSVSFKRHPLQDEWEQEIKAHLSAGKVPTKLALTWDDRISFVLTEKMAVRRLAFLDLLKEQAEKNAEHADEQFDADFALMTGELQRFLPQLIEALGGEPFED